MITTQGAQQIRAGLDGPRHHPPESPAPRYIEADELFLKFTILPWQTELLQRLHLPGYSITTANHPCTEDSLRTKALAAKQRQSKGPQQAASWRGRERSTTYRTK